MTGVTKKLHAKRVWLLRHHGVIEKTELLRHHEVNQHLQLETMQMHEQAYLRLPSEHQDLRRRRRQSQRLSAGSG